MNTLMIEFIPSPKKIDEMYNLEQKISISVFNNLNS